MEQARQLQQRVLVPEPVHSRSFSVESAYYPARSVGGDFYQVLSHEDGSLLIVVGDVSGKGMAAAMLVAVLAGAIRTRADESYDPAALLATLNERLLGRADSHFATCIVAHLLPNGELRLANAGHLPAYRNAVPIEQEGSLPLGLVHGMQYPVVRVQLAAGDALTFLTDGVVEARDPGGQLLGFERLAQLANLPPDGIAKAAIDHGQDDDITVLRVQVMQLQGPAEPALSDAALAAG
jgi:serine phosphatase RsbU (regulator of sigma subunit)